MTSLDASLLLPTRAREEEEEEGGEVELNPVAEDQTGVFASLLLRVTQYGVFSLSLI